MNPLRELKPNQRGRIELLGTSGQSREEAYDGMVREVSADSILLELRGLGDAPRFQVGQRVAFQYWDVFGLHRGVTSVTGVSGERPNELSVAAPATVELTQKRQFFRVCVSVPVVVRGRDGRTIEARTSDLTPIGMRVTLPELFDAGDELDVLIDFARATGESTAPIETRARVVRTAAVDDGWSTSVTFATLPEKEQVRVSLLLFTLQRRVS